MAQDPKTGREILPIPDQPYMGAVPFDARTAAAPPQPTLHAPKGAPNVVLVLIDDMGFGIPSAFGGCVNMPTSDRLAKQGLRYNQMHTTALCSPTRAALLTGRNHHSVNMGVITEFGTSWPGATGMRPNTCATIAEVLKLNGYNTGYFGKSHETPSWEQSVSGPYDRWPTGSGFEKFYGFMGGEMDQFSPVLFDGTARVDPPKTPEQGYHLSDDITDKAAGWIREQQAGTPDKPFFAYVAYGATHAPHQVPESFRGRHKGKFDMGWDKLREETLARQKKAGVVPNDTKLAPRPEGVKPWEQLTADEKLVAARLMENYADFAEHVDWNVGRLVDALNELGVMENTVFFYQLGDNGMSAEGGLIGTHNSILNYNGVDPTIEEMKKHLDEIGAPGSEPHIPVGFAHAGNCPFQWTKQVASHYGGTRNGLIIHWPKGIKSRGETRSQWHHVIDIAPTLLEIIGLPEPVMVNGVPQRPIEGVSMAYTFNDAKAPSRRTLQYFEMFGNRGIYHDGWTAVTKHRTPWLTGQIKTLPFKDDVWELYDTRKDFSQAEDLAAKHPEKVTELRALFLVEAAKYHVFPLDDRTFERANAAIAGRPDLLAGRKSMKLYNGMRLYEIGSAPNLKNTTFTITVDLDSPDGKADGVILAYGGGSAGLSFYLKNGRPKVCYNWFGTLYNIEAPAKLPAGKHSVRFHFDYDGGGLGKGGKMTISVDDKPVANGRIEKTVPFAFSIDTVDVGADYGRPVAGDYSSNVFTGGSLNSVLVELGKEEPVTAEHHEHRLNVSLARE
ncbi:MAG TPA: arylsulfatase [Terriglobia bacterium]|nr:arylsulfatase [Terriglobia bacterium]